MRQWFWIPFLPFMFIAGIIAGILDLYLKERHWERLKRTGNFPK